MRISYERYLDQVLGGWIGKSMGGTIGARFEGYKGWIEISASEMFPEVIPPNDDLDLQVLWLTVLEEKGAAMTSDDLAAAWLEGCWYPFNEYGIFRRNWRLGIHPPMSGRFTNQFWETGEGCPIRSEIWGYVFPGAPDLAARYAWMDGTLDHTEQSVDGEMMFAAMAAMAFFVPDVRRLAAMFIHYLPEGTPIERLTRAAFQAYDEGLSLRDARDRLMALAGIPEACDSQINVPFTFLGLLYGGNDLQEVLLSALRCGYDTDCTLATAGAFVGQILGASRIPQSLKGPIGDDLVMGIQYRREEMTLSALARDTARIGVLLSHVTLHAPVDADEWPMRNLFTVRLEAGVPVEYTFGVAGAGLWKFLGVYYDALPDENDEKQMHRRFNQHFVSLSRDYLPEPDVDVDDLYQAWSRKLGQPAVVASYEHEVDPTQLIGLRGPYCCYLARTVISPEEREAYIVVGNNDGYRLYLNGELVAEEDECLWWAPFNNVYRVTLRQGTNQLLLKLLKRGDDLRFTLGLRAATDEWRPHHNCEDWLVDLVDIVP